MRPFAHARITHLDLAAARGCDGVVLAACQTDLDADNVGEIHCLFYPENRDGSKVARTTKPPMARDIVRHAGDLVAMVVAETRQQAMDALDVIEVDYDPLEAVTDVYDAMAADAPQIHSEYKNNIVFNWEAGAIDKARNAIDDAVAKGAELVEIDVINSRVMPNAMETRPVVAMPCEEIGGLRLWLPSQGPVGLAEQIADALGYQKDQLQVLTGDVGGGFGYKIFLHPEQLCISGQRKPQIVWCAGNRTGQIPFYLTCMGAIIARLPVRRSIRMARYWHWMSGYMPIWVPGCPIFPVIFLPFPAVAP